VCSTKAAQLARICRAIEELAGQPGRGGGAAAEPEGRERSAASGPAQASRPGPAPDPGEAGPEDELAARLAAIWAMVAEADPELAKRVPGYLSATD